MSTVGRYLAIGLVSMTTVSEALAETLEEPQVAIYRDEPRTYAGSSIVQFNVESDLVDQNPGGLMVRVGGRLDDNYGAEVRFGAGLWHEAERDDVPLGVSKVIFDVDYVIGAYFTGRWAWDVPYVRLPLVKQIYAEALVGMVNRQVSAEAEDLVGNTTEGEWDGASASFGVGFGVDFDVPVLDIPAAAGFQYMNYGTLDDVPTAGDDLDISSIEATLQLFF